MQPAGLVFIDPEQNGVEKAQGAPPKSEFGTLPVLGMGRQISSAAEKEMAKTIRRRLSPERRAHKM
jgi:hypothetical protein